MERRYVICPGYVKSQSDEDVHYIGPSVLADLYGLKKGQWTVLNSLYRKEVSDVMLYPRSDGNYTLK